jgi:glycosyltransferase involved in cell wall biosynthesis
LRHLRIIHFLRAPVGGLFRHVRDLAAAQAAAGHRVGIVCDSRTGSRQAELELSQLADALSLGVRRTAMSRNVGWRDLTAYREAVKIASEAEADILHGHGAKGGAYARLAGRAMRRRGREIRVFYTPHGGSLHYSRSSLQGRLYLDLEQRLAAHTDGLIFESAFGAKAYSEKVGRMGVAMRVIPNGLSPGEFYETLVADTAADFLFVGELRKLKGVDVLLDALAMVAARRPASLAIVGAGPDERAFRQQARRLKLTRLAHFLGPKPARTAFTRGRCLIVPSRAESFPYIVLEAGAAQLPIVASDVGGIPEIAGPQAEMLVPPGDAVALAGKLDDFLSDPVPFVRTAEALQARIADKFTIAAMTQAVDDFYVCDLTAQPRLQ